MAGDWIPIRCDLCATPEVLRIASSIKRSADEVVGLLVRFWGWAQAQSSDGLLEGIDAQMVACACHVPERFIDALIAVGWLMREAHGLRIPHFDRWLGNSGKKRLQASFRKRREREKNSRSGPKYHADVTLLSRSERDIDVASQSRECHADVTLLSRKCHAPSVTIEENSIEEYKIYSPPISPPSLAYQSPDGDSSPNGDAARIDHDRIAFDEWWRTYPRKVGKQAALRAYVKARKRICKERESDPDDARQRLRNACLAFAASRKAKSAFCPHPATWLNQGRYDDDPSEWDRFDSSGDDPSLDEVLERALKGPE